MYSYMLPCLVFFLFYVATHPQCASSCGFEGQLLYQCSGKSKNTLLRQSQKYTIVFFILLPGISGLPVVYLQVVA